MWVILVDHSGSMGGGFRESAEQASFRDRRTQQMVKLQAAVESVLIELPRLPPRSDVTLCGFTTSARFPAPGPGWRSCRLRSGAARAQRGRRHRYRGGAGRRADAGLRGQAPSPGTGPG